LFPLFLLFPQLPIPSRRGLTCLRALRGCVRVAAHNNKRTRLRRCRGRPRNHSLCGATSSSIDTLRTTPYNSRDEETREEEKYDLKAIGLPLFPSRGSFVSMILDSRTKDQYRLTRTLHAPTLESLELCINGNGHPACHDIARPRHHHDEERASTLLRWIESLDQGCAPSRNAPFDSR
jgi:hypothetical protein